MDDDLTMVRELGDELDHRPPASLAHQRRRLLAAAEATGSRRRLPVRGWPLLALVGAVTAAAIIVPITLLGGRGPASDPVAAGAGADRLTILLLGVDGPLRGRGRATARADTIMLMQFSTGEKPALVVGLPRDSHVRLPACKARDATTVPARTDRLGGAFTTGGARCMRRSVEALTQVRIDHTVALDYAAMAGLVDEIGGIEVTLRTAINDRRTGLRLPAGEHRLTGAQAVAYARVRMIGSGSDLARVERQSRLLHDILRRAEAQGKDPRKLNALLGAATKAAQVTPELDVRTALQLARRHRSPQRYDFALVPTEPDPADPGRLVWTAAADQIFAPLRPS